MERKRGHYRRNKTKGNRERRKDMKKKGVKGKETVERKRKKKGACDTGRRKLIRERRQKDLERRTNTKNTKGNT